MRGCVSMRDDHKGSSAMSNQPGVEPDRIDLKDEQAMARWAQKLDCTPEQLREAVQAVGDQATDVEMHLKGARSTTNADRVKELGG
jgi:hypothetical protein